MLVNHTKEKRTGHRAGVVERAERGRVHAVESTPSLYLADHAYIAERQLPSKNASLHASHVARPDVFR